MSDEQRPSGDEALDEAIEESFPASDAPGNTVETGIALDRRSDTGEPVIDNAERGQFELVRDGQLAFLKYERRADAIVFVHTEVPDSLRGLGVGETLVKGGLAIARAQGQRIVAVCPFVRAYLRNHPQV